MTAGWLKVRRVLWPALALGVLLVVILLGSPGGVSAAPGPTDLVLTKSDSPDPIVEGNLLTYTITVENKGANDATDVVVTDKLPGSVTFNAATASAGTCTRAGGTVTCPLGQIDAGATGTITITVKANSDGTISNTASLTTSVVDTDPANSQDTETTTVAKAPKTSKKKTKGSKASCLVPTIIGTPGPDSLSGTNGADVIVTGEGDDQIFSGGGNDVVCSGGGSDTVLGGRGNDLVIGSGDRDVMFGEAGNDSLSGKRGRDRLDGGEGNDGLNGGRHKDRCKGGPGSDTKRRCP